MSSDVFFSTTVILPLKENKPKDIAVACLKVFLGTYKYNTEI